MTALLHAHANGAGFSLPTVLLHATAELLKLLPFLFFAYLLSEWLVRAAGPRVRYAALRAGRLAPLVGGLLGAIPQCGFSAATAGLYARRVLTLGTLLAVFLSTSDEMLPILLAGGASPLLAVKLVAFKCAVGITIGFATDGVLRLLRRRARAEAAADSADADEGDCPCGCCGGARAGFGGVLLSALRHTLSVALWLYLTVFAFECAVHLIGTEAIGRALSEAGFLTVLLSALLGLIPSCAVSVILTELWITGALGTGAMLAGLLVSAGVGLLVLFRSNRPMRENVLILALLYALSAGVGLLLEGTGLASFLFGK